MSAELPRALSVAEIAARLGANIEGDGARSVLRLSSLESAGPDAIAFISGRRHVSAACRSQAGAILVAPALAASLPAGMVKLVIADPYLAYARLSQWVASMRDMTPDAPLIHPMAWVDPEARLGANVRVEAGASVAAQAEIGDDCRIAAGCSIGRGARIGAGSVLHARVTLYADVSVGARAILHAGTVIGADGFGFAPSASGWVKIAQLGSVRIGDDVEIGANCAIDRGALDDTVIGSGVKIDNLVQIGHNVRIGRHCILVSQVGISGSTRLGDRVTVAGQVGIAGHLEIADNVVLLAKAGVTKSLTEPGAYTGFPAKPLLEGRRLLTLPGKIPDILDRLRALEKRLAELEAAANQAH